jgi:hypothetical protein
MNTSPLIAAVIAAAPALAQEHRASLTAMFSVDGKCQMLIVSEEERPCKDLVVNTEYDSGRIGFYFIDDGEGGGIISFSGMGQEQRSPAENLRLQPLDAVILDGGRVPAVGICSFENPFAGQARIQCSAFIESGEMFSGFFISDGREPKLISSEANDG